MLTDVEARRADLSDAGAFRRWSRVLYFIITFDVGRKPGPLSVFLDAGFQT
jgi:hypothetical protein